jgi:hypothetical protein
VVPAEVIADPLPLAAPVAILEGPAGSLGDEWIVIRKRFFGARIDNYLLDLTLTELRTSGAEVFIGSQRVALTDTDTAPIGAREKNFVVVEVGWVTGPIEANSHVRACVQVQQIRPDDTIEPVGELECRELTPLFPF